MSLETSLGEIWPDFFQKGKNASIGDVLQHKASTATLQKYCLNKQPQCKAPGYERNFAYIFLRRFLKKILGIVASKKHGKRMPSATTFLTLKRAVQAGLAKPFPRAFACTSYQASNV